MPTALYRHFDAAGKLLYVGIAANPLVRWKGHKERAPWVRRIATITIEWFVTREMARRCERLAATHEKPAHNQADKPFTARTRIGKVRKISHVRPRPDGRDFISGPT